MPLYPNLSRDNLVRQKLAKFNNCSFMADDLYYFLHYKFVKCSILMDTTFLFVRHLLRGHDLGKDLPLTCTCWYGNLEHFQGKLFLHYFVNGSLLL